MKVVDTKRSWIVNGKVRPANIPFDADEKAMNEIAAQSDSFFELDELEKAEAAAPPEPKPIKDKVEDASPSDEEKSEGEDESSHEEPKDDADPSDEDAEKITARYTGRGGWYQLSDGRKVRRKDIPEGVVIE